MLVVGFNAAFANAADDKNKQPKNTGILSVKTTPESYPVKVDGQVVGMSGTGAPAEFYLAPGIHTIEVGAPAGMAAFTKEIDVRKNQRNCICLKTITTENKRDCPYNVQVDGPESAVDGDLVTFVARSLTSANPANYVWTISPSAARITSGLGTSSITVDTTGIGGQTVTAELDVSDGSPDDAICRQHNSFPTPVKPITVNTPPPPVRFDEFVSRSNDDDKARFDNLAIELQNHPDYQGYIILYQGTEKKSRNADALGKLAMNYLVNVRGIPPQRIVITKWGTQPQTKYEIWLIPPGAQPPVPN